MSIDVFISYASLDRKIVSQLAQRLEQHGLEIWWDESLQVGGKFRSELQKKLDAARKVLVLWTQNSVSDDRDFVWDEAARAKELKKLVPCRLADLDQSQIPLGFGELHTISFSMQSLEEGVRKIAAALRRPSFTDQSTVTADPVLEGGPPIPLSGLVPEQQQSLLWRLTRRFFARRGTHDPNLTSGMDLLERGEWLAAIAKLSDAIETAPAAPLAYEKRAKALAQLGKWQDCLDDCTRALEWGATDRSTTTLQGGLALLNLSNWKEANQWFDAAIDCDPKSALAYHYRGYAYAQTRNWQVALDNVEHALSLDRNFAEPHWLKGSILVELKRPHEAIDWLNKSISRLPDLALLYYVRGLAHAHLSGWPETIADCEQALAISRSIPEAYWLSGFAKAYDARHDLEGAASDFRSAIELKPDHENSIHALLWTMAKKSDWQAVLDVSTNLLSKAIEWGANILPVKGPSDIESIVFTARVRALRAEAFRVLNLYTECADECDSILRAQPHFADALRVRAMSHIQQGNHDLALRDLAQAIKIDPNDA